MLEGNIPWVEDLDGSSLVVGDRTIEPTAASGATLSYPYAWV
jgi:hypothetical protein